MNKKYLVVSHTTDLEGPTEALIDYLMTKNVLHKAIMLPMHYCSDRRVRVISSECNSTHFSKPYTTGLLFSCVKDFIFTLTNLFGLKKDNAELIYIGIDPLNCFAGLILKLLGQVDQVIFYTIDWMPNRFTNPLLNSFYHLIDKLSSIKSDITWNLTEKINDIRNKYNKSPGKNLIVPVGAYIQNRNLPSDSIRKNVVLLGALTPSKGVDLIIKAWPIVLEKIPDAKLHIIGKTPNDSIEDGVRYMPYESRLENLGSSVCMHGVIKRSEVYKKLLLMDLGLALYKPTEENLSNWADPSRVKDYLASGVPVLITDVPPIAKDVSKFFCGAIIEYEPESLA